MGQYCVVCGQLKAEDGICRNPNCRVNHRAEEPPRGGSTPSKTPIRLEDRLKQSRAMTQPVRDSHRDPVEEDPSFREEPVQSEPVPWDDSEPVEESGEWDDPADLPAPSGDRARVYSRISVSSRFRDFRRELSEDRPENRVLGGLLTVLVSVLLSAGGTLLFGMLYLEDFFWRWTVTGVIAPLMAYGVSLLYARLFLLLGRGEYRFLGTRAEVLNLLSTVTSTGRIPNILLMLTCFLAPMDKDLGIFQFFALLLAVAWLVSLMFSVLSAYRPFCNRYTLLLTIVFAFLAMTTLRSLWVWYLTGEFRFTLYIPLNIFF